MKRGGLLIAVAAIFAAPAAAGQSSGPGVDPLVELASLDRRLSDAASREKADEAELARTADTMGLAHERVAQHGRSFYKLTRAGLLPVGGGFQALVEHAMLVERARRRLERELTAQRDLQRHASDIARELDALRRDERDLTAQRQSLVQARSQMEDDARRRQAFERAFDSSSPTEGDYVAVYGGAGASVEGDSPAGGFASAKGRLLFPVAGRAEVHPAQREGTAGPGIEIRADAGAVVRAVFAGRIAFADRYGPYGRIVIIDHGDHYYTVSGNLDSIDVKVGQEVDAGDRIGSVGDDGQGPLLYFEVRHGARTIPPGPWLGL